MELKTKYQYSYFIHPYIINEQKYDKYLLKLLKDKNCKMKIFEKEKDLDLYTYFLPNVRDYMFWTFELNNNKLKSFEQLSNSMKVSILSKKPCTIFEYDLGKDVQGKIGEKSGVFFDISRVEIICFNTGICFLLLKTVLEGETNLSDVLNFNYKFRDINSEFISLKDYENIRIQTNTFKDIKDLSAIIKQITGVSKDAKEMNLDDERFLTYSYFCTEQDNWNDTNDFENIQGEFSKFANILPSNYEINYDKQSQENQTLKSNKYVKIGITKQGTVLLTSSINTENYTKIPFSFEQEYLYTYILALYKKIYLKKVNLEFKKIKNTRKIRDKFIEFTQSIWIQEITNDLEGSKLYQKWIETLELDMLYANAKNKYDIVYKDLKIDKANRVNYIIAVILGLLLIINIINFLMMYFGK